MAAKAGGGGGGGSELLEKFGRQPLINKIGIFVGIGAVLGGLYWYMFYGDLQDQLKSGQANAKKLAGDEIKLKDRLKQYRELVDKKKAIEQQLSRNQVALPASSELPAFFVSLQAQAIAANVQLVMWDRLSEEAVETYVKVPVKMEIRGDYYQILEYFKLLYETRRIITVEDLRLGEVKSDGDRRVMTATFVASTFRQADQPARKVDPKAPAAPAGGAGQPGAAPAGGGAAPAPAPAAPAGGAAPAPAPGAATPTGGN